MDQIVEPFYAQNAQLMADEFNAQASSDLFRVIQELASKEGKYSIKLEPQNYSLGEYLARKYRFQFNRETGELFW